MTNPRAAVLEDYQDVVRTLPYWAQLRGRVDVDFYSDAVTSEDTLLKRLQPYRILIPIRERTRFPAATLDRLPELELLAITGRNSGHVDVPAATRHGVLVVETGGSGVSAIEHTIGMILAVVRHLPQEDRAMRTGRWQTTMGIDLAGKTLGVVGLGRIGGKIAFFGTFLGMKVLAPGADRIRKGLISWRRIRATLFRYGSTREG